MFPPELPRKSGPALAPKTPPTVNAPRPSSPKASLQTAEVDGNLRFYRDQAQAYFESTAHLDLAAVRAKLTRRLSPGARLVEAGCGSGRDTKAFALEGFDVQAFDASPELVALAREHTGLSVACSTFEQWEAPPEFDAVWACSSLVHLDAPRLEDALSRLVRSLKPNGWLYTNFKTGSSPEATEDGRRFHRATESEVRALLARQGLCLHELWTTASLRSSSVEWLNVLATKQI